MAHDARYWTDVEELFDAAVDLNPTGRAALLDARCAQRLDVRSEVEALLDAHVRAGDFIVPVTVQLAHPLSLRSQPRTTRNPDPQTSRFPPTA
jgi:hypothetical protein